MIGTIGNATLYVAVIRFEFMLISRSRGLSSKALLSAATILIQRGRESVKLKILEVVQMVDEGCTVHSRIQSDLHICSRLIVVLYITAFNSFSHRASLQAPEVAVNRLVVFQSSHSEIHFLRLFKKLYIAGPPPPRSLPFTG